MGAWYKDMNAMEADYGLIVFTRAREDVEDKLGRTLTDAEWDKVRLTKTWRRASSDDTINDMINMIVWDAIYEAEINMTEEVI